MSERAKIIELVMVCILVAASIAAVVVADPSGATNVKVIDSERAAMSGSAQSTPAEAGNVTELLVNGTMITKTWQGYYGNVTGVIVLADASDNEMYMWTDASFSGGEIYATNSSTVSWSNVNCFNLTGYDDELAVNRSGNLTYFESYLGLGTSDVDGIDETFASTTHSAFDIGARTMTADTCSMVKTYVSDAPQSSSSDFIEVILFDNSTDVAVFAGLLNNSVTGFDDRAWDFQLLVPVEGGHDTPATTDTFYFFTELE
jgi:hypothetical protein